MRPAPYPGGEAPAHIHVTLMQPGREPYYIDDILFDDDPLLTDTQRRMLKHRGGNGIITLTGNKTLQSGKRDIWLLP